MSGSFDLIIFDYDGVIADSELLNNTVMAELLTEISEPVATIGSRVRCGFAACPAWPFTWRRKHPRQGAWRSSWTHGGSTTKDQHAHTSVGGNQGREQHGGQGRFLVPATVCVKIVNDFAFLATVDGAEKGGVGNRVEAPCGAVAKGAGWDKIRFARGA